VRVVSRSGPGLDAIAEAREESRYPPESHDVMGMCQPVLMRCNTRRYHSANPAVNSAGESPRLRPAFRTTINAMTTSPSR